jgi:hypothetical protein
LNPDGAPTEIRRPYRICVLARLCVAMGEDGTAQGMVRNKFHLLQDVHGSHQAGYTSRFRDVAPQAVTVERLLAGTYLGHGVLAFLEG